MQPQQTVVSECNRSKQSCCQKLFPAHMKLMYLHYIQVKESTTVLKMVQAGGTLGTKFWFKGTRTYATKISHVNFLQATRRHRSSANAAHYNPSGIQSKAASQDGGALIAVQSGTECAASLVFFLLQPFFLRPG